MIFAVLALLQAPVSRGLHVASPTPDAQTQLPNQPGLLEAAISELLDNEEKETLDKLDKKLDEKLDAKLNPITEKISKLTDGLNALTLDAKSSVSTLRKFPANPVPCRDDFAKVAQRYFYKTHKAAEIGVWQGAFAEKNLHFWVGTYYMVDAWAYRPGDPGDKNFADDEFNKANMIRAENRTSFASERRHLIQALSCDAAKQFGNASLDWIFLDALHTKAAVLSDLQAWYDKLRPGGLMSGDDYGDAQDTEWVTAKQWAKHYGNVAKNPRNNWGVITALSEFTRSHGAELHVTWLNDCYPLNAWYFVKP